MTCHACGAQLSATARFCHKCGAAIASAQATGWRAGLPWALAGAALGALVTVVAMRAGAGTRGQGAESPPSSAAPRSGIAAPDISKMSPDERANRLFDRVMILAQAGQDDSVRFFLPMALGAYDMLPSRDADAHYDVGLLYLAGGDAKAALARADSIQKSAPNHLFAYVLRAHAYQQEGDRAAEKRAYRDFLRNEASELRLGRPEYTEHAKSLAAFRSEAVRVIGDGSR